MANDFRGFDEETTRRVSNVGDAIKEIKEQTRDLNRELANAGGPLSDWESSFSSISNLSRKILDTQDKSLRSSKGTGESLKRQNEAKNTARALDVKINELLRQRVQGNDILNDLINRQASNLREAKDQAKILAEEYGKLAESAAGLDKKTLIFSKLAEFTKDVKGLRAFSSPFEAAAKASREQVLQNEKAVLLQKKLEELRKAPFADRAKIRKEISEITEGKGIKETLAGKGGTFGAGMKAFTGEISEGISGFLKGGGPLLIGLQLIVKAIQFFVDAMFAADERVTKLAKGMMLTKDEARGVYNSLKDTKFEIDSIYNTTKDVTEAYTDLVELTGFVTSATNDMVEAQIILTKNLGLSKEEAFGVQEAFVAFNLEADKGMDIIKNQVIGFTAQNKLIVSNKTVFSDIAKTSKLIQINFKDNLGGLVKTTLEAKKLGLSLDQVRKIGDSLLDFEQSISSELEAELLTGKDLNLERARAYALNHDIAGLTQEMTKQGITQEYFANLNAVQQESLAKAYGMQADEMADMLYKAKVLEKVGGKTLKDLRERARVTEDINLQRKVAALEQGILDGKSYDEAVKATSTQEKFNQSLERAKAIFSDFVDGEYLDDLANAIEDFANFVSGTTPGYREARKNARMLKESAKTQAESEEISSLEAQSGGLKLGLKSKIELGVVSLIYGPLLSFFESYINVNAKNAQEQLQLMKEHNEHLKNISQKEGTVTLDGTKMGTAMAVSGYKS